MASHVHANPSDVIAMASRVRETTSHVREMASRVREMASDADEMASQHDAVAVFSGEPVANVQLEIVGEGITRVSSERGYNTVQNLVSGAHQLMVTHPNYVTQTIPFTIVSGETTELVVVLEKV